MAGEKDDKTIPDQEDNIYDEGEFQEDGTADIIRDILKDDEDDDPDDGGFDQPPVDKAKDQAPDVVGPEEGRDLIDDAEMAKAKTHDDDRKSDDQKPDVKTEGEDDETTAKSDEKKDEKPDVKTEGEDDSDGKDDKPDLSASDIDSLLDGVDDERKGEITRRLAETDKLLAPFRDEKVQSELKMHGTTAEAAIGRFIELNSFAQEKPDEYVAWLASEMNKEAPHEVLGKAAGLLGYKLVQDKGDEGGDDDDDPFADEEKAALKKKVRELEAAQKGDGPSFGPDTPERQRSRTIQQTITNFINETDEKGQPKRPLFQQVSGNVANRAATMHRETGRALTVDDLDRIYNEEVESLRAAFGQPKAADPAEDTSGKGSAAQTDKGVSDQLRKKAASAQKAQRASKSVDGTGQGASRRPALSDDTPLDDVIRHFAKAE